MSDTLTGGDLVQLVKRVFQPASEDTGLAVLVDLPDDRLPDNPRWKDRRAMAADWVRKLNQEIEALGLPRVTLAWYPNAGGNNADLPETCVVGAGEEVLDSAAQLAGRAAIQFRDLFETHSLVIAPTELSATAPLKMMVKDIAVRAATMPGFLASMIPALKIDYTEVNRRVNLIKDIVDPAVSATAVFRARGKEHTLVLDLRHRKGHASGGLFPDNGTAGNLPSGETYIVPYEGEVEGEASRTSGTLPVQFGDEVVVYRIDRNRAVEVMSEGAKSRAERDLLVAEPAYANLAELGLGVLGDFNLKPTGSILLDEKLGLHIAFGRSDHFGGIVGPGDFSKPEAVVHIDRVYIKEMQPDIDVVSLVVEGPEGAREIMRDGCYRGVF